MNCLKVSFHALVVSALTLMVAVPAWATETSVDELLKQGADAVLQEADQRANPAPDMTRLVKMILRGDSDNGKEIMMEQKTKNGTRTAIRFSKPADLNGLALVIKGDNEIYVKLPGSKKVRRVAAHARKQGFQGTDFSLDDLKMLRFAPHFSAKLLKDDGKELKLELTRKAESDIPYSRLIVTMDREVLIPKSITYFDEDGTKVKEQVRSELIKMKDGTPTFRKVTMTDLIRKHVTELVVVEQDSAKNIPAKTFTKRWLIRGS